MNAKRIIVIGAMAFAITIGGGIWSSDKASADSPEKPGTARVKELHCPVRQIAFVEKADFHEVLGAASGEEVYEALYNGKSLADIARDNGADIDDVIKLQIGELTEQLDARLASGSLSQDDYLAQRAELEDIVTSSAHGLAYR